MTIVSTTYYNNEEAFANVDFDEENRLFSVHDCDFVEQINDAIYILGYEYDEYHQKMRLYKASQQ